MSDSVSPEQEAWKYEENESSNDYIERQQQLAKTPEQKKFLDFSINVAKFCAVLNRAQLYSPSSDEIVGSYLTSTDTPSSPSLHPTEIPVKVNTNISVELIRSGNLYIACLEGEGKKSDQRIHQLKDDYLQGKKGGAVERLMFRSFTKLSKVATHPEVYQRVIKPMMLDRIPSVPGQFEQSLIKRQVTTDITHIKSLQSVLHDEHSPLELRRRSMAALLPSGVMLEPIGFSSRIPDSLFKIFSKELVWGPQAKK